MEYLNDGSLQFIAFIILLALVAYMAVSYVHSLEMAQRSTNRCKMHVWDQTTPQWKCVICGAQPHLDVASKEDFEIKE